MSRPGVVASFVGFRTVPARRVLVLTVDVPSTDGPAAMDHLGWPVAGTSKHVALVRTGEGAEPLHATFEGCRTVAGRGAVALTFELPEELAHVAMKRLGVPTSGAPVPVVVALLTEAPAPVRTGATGKSPGERAVQQAALRVGDEPFQRFLLGPAFVPGDAAGNKEQAVVDLRQRLRIESRAELRTDRAALERWHALVWAFERYLQRGDGPRRG